MSDMSEPLFSDRRAMQRNGRERRVARRLNCSGVGEVVTIDGMPAFKGKVCNLSLTGCRLQIEQATGLEQGTQVEIVLEVNNIRFRVVGEVRSEDTDTGIGFQFIRLSRRCEDYIRELIGELEELHQASQLTAKQT